MDNEITDFSNRENRLKGTKHFERRKLKSKIYIFIAIIVLFYALSLIYATAIANASTTRQMMITNAQIINGIPQRHYQITYSN